MVNDLDAILDLPNDALVTCVGQELQRVVEEEGYNVDAISLMGKCSVNLDVAKTWIEMVEWLRCQEEAAQL